VSFHADGAGGLLFNGQAQTIFQLDHAAAFLWCSLAEDCAAADLARDYAHRADIGLDEAMAHLTALIDRWRGMGLLADSAIADDTAFGGRSRADGVRIPLSVSPRRPVSIACRVLNADIAVRFVEPALARLCAPLLDGLAGPPPRAWNALIDVRRVERGGAALLCPGRPPFNMPNLRELAPAVLATVVRVALQHSADYPAVHAAMVSMPDGAVVLPAPSGRGKSTLAAGLWSAGFETMCDETIVLNRETMAASPVIPYICLKSGSWPAIADRLPGLWQHPAYRRPDGMHVRYIRTGGGRTPRHALPVRALVFPGYDPTRPTEWHPLTTAQALDRLLPCVDPIGHGFDAADIDRLIAWVDGVDRYALSHASVEDGIAAVREIASA
jgi:hypothetical protein